jgi:RNA-binding protein NOB1
VIDKNGEKKVLINFKRPIKVKGTNQQLPRPRGGKHANNPILAPDQKVSRDKQDKLTLNDKKNLTMDYILSDPGYLVRTNPFAQRSSQTGRRRRK